MIVTPQRVTELLTRIEAQALDDISRRGTDAQCWCDHAAGQLAGVIDMLGISVGDDQGCDRLIIAALDATQRIRAAAEAATPFHRNISRAGAGAGILR